jgi:hypothetical protein
MHCALETDFTNKQRQGWNDEVQESLKYQDMNKFSYK